MKKELALKRPWALKSLEKNIYRSMESAGRLRDNLLAGEDNGEKLAGCLEELDGLGRYMIHGCSNKEFYSNQDFILNLHHYSGALDNMGELGRELCSGEMPPEVRKAAGNLYELVTGWEDKELPELPEPEHGAEEESGSYAKENKPRRLTKRNRRMEPPGRSNMKMAVRESINNNRPKKKSNPKPGRNNPVPKTPDSATSYGNVFSGDYTVRNSRNAEMLNRECRRLGEVVPKLRSCSPGRAKRYVEEIEGISGGMFNYIIRKCDEKYELLGAFGAPVMKACETVEGVCRRLPDKEEIQKSALVLQSIKKHWTIQYQLLRPLSKDTIYAQPFVR